jgi:phosphoglycolate phosphatase
MLPPEAVVFDLDGTLIDSRGDIVAAMNHALIERGRRPLPGQVIIRFVGDGARSLCARSAGLAEGDAEVEELYRQFVDYYVEHPVEFTRWMPGAQEMLDALAEIPGLSLGICTNKPRMTTDAVLAALGVRTRFRAVVAGGDLSEKKPAPGPLLLAAKLLHVSTDVVVMVGDGPQDIECARRAGARAIGYDSGFSSRQRMMDARPDLVIAGLGEVPDVIVRWREATVRLSIAR